MAEAIKGVKTDKFQNCFEQWKKCLDRCIASNGEYFEGDRFKHVKVNTQLFINKFQDFEVLLIASVHICRFITIFYFLLVPI